MTTKNDGGPVHPTYDGDTDFLHLGMTLRDYFAAAALKGLIASPSIDDAMSTIQICACAYEWADAMLAERAK